MDAGRLEAIAHELLKLAHEMTGGRDIDGVSPEIYLKDPRAYPGYAWKYMQMLYAEDRKPRTFKPWGQGIMPADAGGRGKMPKAYDQYRAMWEQAQRDGFFNMNGQLPKPEAEILAALVELYNSPWGVGWRNDPRTKGMIPEGPPKE